MNEEYSVITEVTPGLKQHTYYLNKAGKLAAFKPEGGTEVTHYTKPMEFSKTRRKFKKG